MPVSLLALVSVLGLALVSFVLGFLCGDAHGSRRARIDAFNQCLDWAALSMKGHPAWRYLSADRALTKAGALIGGNDIVLPPQAAAPSERVAGGFVVGDIASIASDLDSSVLNTASLERN